MTSSNRKHLSAWLGIFAIWLIVFAPLVSQLLQRAHAHAPWAPLCSAALPADAAHHGPLSGTLNACGYCDLLAHHAPAPPQLPAPMALSLAAAAAMVPALATRFTAWRLFPSARPRDPPLASS